MKTVEIIRGTFEGKYHAGDMVSVPDSVAEILISEKFARIAEQENEQDASDYDFASADEICAMSTKKELEIYAASIGMMELDGRMKIKDMQTAILNYQEELIDKKMPVDSEEPTNQDEYGEQDESGEKSEDQ